MRILSWNLWGFRGDAGVVARVVSDLSPDLMLVQETPWIWRPRRRLRDWADRLGLQVLAGEWCGRALAILGTEAVAEIATGSSVRRSWQAPSTRFPYPRGIAAVRLSPTRGGAFVAASVHFGLDPADRLRHARQLVGLIGSAQAPVVIGGDFNEPCAFGAAGADGAGFGPPAGGGGHRPALRLHNNSLAWNSGPDRRSHLRNYSIVTRVGNPDRRSRGGVPAQVSSVLLGQRRTGPDLTEVFLDRI